MSYKAIVTRLRNVRPHPNADRVKLATCHGNQVVVGLNNEEGQLGGYFPCDGQLSPEFCRANNLYRDVTKNQNPDIRGGMFDDNRRVRAQKFRGEISDGFWVPMNNFDFITDFSENEGYEFDQINAVPICNKYINPNTIKAAQQNQGKKTKAAKTSIMFKEHFDTEHFGRHLGDFKEDEILVLTEKVHGTSGRVGHVLVDRKMTWKDRFAKWIGSNVTDEIWGYLNGTRRVVLEETSGTQFHDPTIREKAFEIFKGNLRKGETFYFEIVGYEPDGKTIMPSVDTTKLGDKKFTETYGKTMTYSYGCEIGKSDVYVYRITMTGEDGHSVDLSWNDVKSRCSEIGVKHVPEITKVSLNEIRLRLGTSDPRDVQDELMNMVDLLAQGPSLLDSKHIREGVCVKIDQYGLTPKVYKHKSFEFKVLEGIVKDSGVVDAEEAQG
jgi:hypothetical protein